MNTKRTRTKKRLMKMRRRVTTSPRPAGIALCLCVALLASSAYPLKDQKKDYALIFGTAYGPDDRPLYGAAVHIHPVGKKRPSWDLMSDHRGEFAQRVPLQYSDYEVAGEAEFVPLVDGKPQRSRKKRVRVVVKVHIDRDVVQDIGLHFKE
jgi:hypothetical protein